jgi:hypothetical protein
MLRTSAEGAALHLLRRVQEGLLAELTGNSFRGAAAQAGVGRMDECERLDSPPCLSIEHVAAINDRSFASQREQVESTRWVAQDVGRRQHDSPATLIERDAVRLVHPRWKRTFRRSSDGGERTEKLHASTRIRMRCVRFASLRLWIVGRRCGTPTLIPSEWPSIIRALRPDYSL